MEPANLLTQVRAQMIGKEVQKPAIARDPVNQPMIRRWAEAMGDANPLWHDPQMRSAFGFQGAVAPPAMLEVWTMPPYRSEGRTEDVAGPRQGQGRYFARAKGPLPSLIPRQRHMT